MLFVYRSLHWPWLVLIVPDIEIFVILLGSHLLFAMSSLLADFVFSLNRANPALLGVSLHFNEVVVNVLARDSC